MTSLRNLQTLLLAVVLLALLPMLGLGIHSGLSYRAQALETAQQNTLLLIRLLVGEQQQAVNAVSILMQVLGEGQQAEHQNGIVASARFASLLRHFPQFTNIMTLTAQGMVSASAVEDYQGMDFASDEAVALALSTRSLALGSYHVCPVTGKMIATFAQPVQDASGNIHGILALHFDMSYAGNLIRAVGLPPGATFVMSDSQGTILYRFPDLEHWQGKPVQSSLHEIMLEQGADEGVFRAKGLDDISRLYAFKLFTMGQVQHDIHMRIGIPVSAILRGVDNLLLLHMTGAIVVAALVLLLARVCCVRLLFRPVSRLITTAQDIAKGHLHARTDLPHSEDDIGLLATAFDSMAAALQRREQEQKKAAQRIFESGERIRAMLNASSDAVILADTAGTILVANPIAGERRGKHPEEMVGTSLFDALPPDSACLRKDKMAETIQRGATVGFEEKRGDRWYGNRIHPIHDSQGAVVQLVSYSRDITERKLAEERLKRQAFEDSLTGLANRALFDQELEMVMREAQRSPSCRYAVLFLDLDNFKLVNDSFGHLAGDSLLLRLAKRLQNAVGPKHLIARFGGDEFAVLVPQVVDSFEVLRLADAIHQALQPPEHVHGLEIHCSASIGIVYGKSEYTMTQHVLRDADIAMYQAKARGRGQTECFTLDMRDMVNKRLRLENQLRSALENGELLLHYQPYYSLPEQRLVGFEALIRWQHPEQGLVPPAQFIPIAEETGLIQPLGAFVLEEACKAIKIWNQAIPQPAPLRINVNLSPRQMFHGDPVALVRDTLVRTGLEPELLVLEITETSLADDVEHVADILETLQHFGVQTALDDFGTGYSSLAYLRNLPLDMLKLDRSFIQRLDRDNRDTAIAARIVDLAHTLDMSVTAEGVENAAVLRQLELMRCDTVQGFHLSRPLTADAARKHLLAFLS